MQIDRSLFPTPEQRAAERSAKREAVLLAAVTMFNDRGFSATSLDDVAASLGVTKPVIYHYLGTKDQVLFESVARGMKALAQAVDAAEGSDGATRLRAFLIHFARNKMTPFGRCVALTADHELSVDSRRRFRDFRREIDTRFRELIAAGIADGSLRNVDVRLATFALAGALNWIPRWQKSDGPIDEATLATTFVDTLMRGFLPMY